MLCANTNEKAGLESSQLLWLDGGPLLGVLYICPGQKDISSKETTGFFMSE